MQPASVSSAFPYHAAPPTSPLWTAGPSAPLEIRSWHTQPISLLHTISTLFAPSAALLYCSANAPNAPLRREGLPVVNKIIKAATRNLQQHQMLLHIAVARIAPVLPMLHQRAQPMLLEGAFRRPPAPSTIPRTAIPAAPLLPAADNSRPLAADVALVTTETHAPGLQAPEVRTRERRTQLWSQHRQHLQDPLRRSAFQHSTGYLRCCFSLASTNVHESTGERAASPCPSASTALCAGARVQVLVVPRALMLRRVGLWMGFGCVHFEEPLRQVSPSAAAPAAQPAIAAHASGGANTAADDDDVDSDEDDSDNDMSAFAPNERLSEEDAARRRARGRAYKVVTEAALTAMRVLRAEREACKAALAGLAMEAEAGSGVETNVDEMVDRAAEGERQPAPPATLDAATEAAAEEECRAEFEQSLAAIGISRPAPPCSYPRAQRRTTPSAQGSRRTAAGLSMLTQVVPTSSYSSLAHAVDKVYIRHVELAPVEEVDVAVEDVDTNATACGVSAWQQFVQQLNERGAFTMNFDNFYTPDPQLGYGVFEGPDFRTRTLTRRTLPVTRTGFADPRQSLSSARPSAVAEVGREDVGVAVLGPLLSQRMGAMLHIDTAAIPPVASGH
ncbi:hypothetical protein HYPSUDRAFT_206640 [Hypholoma sublateritium FD-334 SS-4]|uniref:Uncharacterized protein n=1 Tax=Hypholoma sublateritium (strain FD-334 SS-4) TaxID=945553 RepID=A0A0D2P9C5_HYPSF|nr:hypothetical protein HYPSUDRAFT_206640 [Hypholoma sublateritium FD-334 SS-4]